MMLTLWHLAAIIWLCVTAVHVHHYAACRNIFVLAMANGPAGVFAGLSIRLIWGIPSTYIGVNMTLGIIMVYAGLAWLGGALGYVWLRRKRARLSPRVGSLTLAAAASLVLITGGIMAVPIARALPVLQPVAKEMTCYMLNCAGLPTLAEKILCCREHCAWIDEAACQKEALEDPNIKEVDKVFALAQIFMSAKGGNQYAVASMRETREIADPMLRLYGQTMNAQLTK